MSILACCVVLQRLQGAQQGKVEQPGARTGLLACLARLIRGAAPAVVRAQQAQLLPWALAALGDARLGDEAAVTALLLMVSEALMDPSGVTTQSLCALQSHFNSASSLVLHKGRLRHPAEKGPSA